MQEERYRELDALRGVALLLMVLYHFVFDLAYFYDWDIPVLEGGWKFLARTSATTFLLLVGLCFVISWERQPKIRNQKPVTFLSLYRKYLRRGLTIFAGGMLISLATWFIVPHAFVKFGILHLIGISALLQPLFTPFKIWNFFLGLTLIALPAFSAFPAFVQSPILFPLGIPYPSFASLDYYPLVPWFGVILLGMALGNILYVPTRHPTLTSVNHIILRLLPAPRSAVRVVGACGRYALWIYFVHQPALLLLLALMLGGPNT